ncbi:general odorant-binding protein 68 isoform X2 [Drosophila busckii]|nr:general odorant-binding protein 68 isoform X2 [Drosophila busckii]
MQREMFILFAYLFWHSFAIQIDCNTTETINEDHIHLCCKHPDGHNELIANCAKKHHFKLPNDKEQSLIDLTADRAIAGTCFAQCVFKDLHFMSSNSLDMAAVRKHFQQTYAADAEYAKEMINAFDHCHGKSEDSAAQFSQLFIHSNKEHCDPKPSVILACVIRDFFHNCPANRWAKTPECQQTLEFSKQ